MAIRIGYYPQLACFFFLAALVCYLLLLKFGKLNEWDDNFSNWLFIVCYTGGYFGARALSIAIEESHIGIVQNLLALLKPGPMTYYGGLIGALLSGLIFIYLKKIPFLRVADVCLPIGFIGLGIGRIGCFLNGDDFGIAVPVRVDGSIPWWAVVFPNHPDPIPRFPVQLVESAVASLIGVVFLILLRKRTSNLNGWYASSSLACYSIFRFFIEYFRDDDRGWIIQDYLTPSQGISMFFLVMALSFFAYKSVVMKSFKT